MAFCVRGYWLIGRLTSERSPSTRISRLTTLARTGRRMKMSVKFIACALVFLRSRVRAVGWLHRVVDRDRCAVLQFQLAAADDLLALLQTLQDGDLVAPRLACRHKDLFHNPLAAALGILLFGGFDDENSRTVG